MGTLRVYVPAKVARLKCGFLYTLHVYYDSTLNKFHLIHYEIELTNNELI